MRPKTAQSTTAGTFVPETLIVQRKSEHLRIVAEQNVAHNGSHLLENIQLIHQALPEVDQKEIDLSIDFFGKRLNSALMITSMTGGAEYAGQLNKHLAKAASEKGIAFSTGSQRVMIRHPEMSEDFAVRKYIPDGVLLGNIGGVQLLEYPTETIVELVDAIDADGICVHLNAGQELMQPEGHRSFKGVIDGIARLLDALDGKLLVKETGAGLGPETLSKLDSIGVRYIDVAGSGGTSWTKVEMYRTRDKSLKQLSETYQDWGLPTAFCTYAARKLMHDDVTIVASGGIRTGLDAARAIAAGAHIAGFATPVLKAFLDDGYDGAISWIEQLEEELRTAMILTGCATIQDLRKTNIVITGKLREYLNTYGWLNGAER